MTPIAYFFVGLFVLIIIIFFFVTVRGIKNLKQHIEANVNYHLVAIDINISRVSLSIDGKIVDEISSYKMTTAKLQSNLDGENIIVNIGSGFMKPTIITFIGGTKNEQLSNK